MSEMSSEAIRRHLTAVREQQSGMRFCTSCQCEAKVASGWIRKAADGKRRFVCQACAARATARRRG